MPDTQVGRSLGPYRILAPLGAGGMAQVYRAVHTQLNRPVAIKILRPDLALGAEFPDRFRREAQAVARLRNPHIVQIFDFDASAPRPTIVMELLEGGSLRDLLNECAARGDRLPLPEAVRIVADALDGLAHAHAAGIVHRDLKPGNILLSRDGRAVLTDFGIAVVPGDAANTATGAMMGTLAYMAPEQGLRGQAGVASDVYAMGVILYELATGRVPFEGDTPLGTLMKHVNEPLPDPRELTPNLPVPIADVIRRALEKQPEARYAAAADMRADLVAALATAGLPLADRVVLPEALVAAVVSGDRRQALEGRFDNEAPTETPLAAPADTRSGGSRVGGAVFLSLAVLFLVNLTAVGLAGMQGRPLEVIVAGWPFEFFWVAFFLSLLGRALRTSGFIVPVGILLSVGVPTAYAAVTARWGEWWWWVFAAAAAPTFIIGAYALARRDPPRSRDRVNALLVALSTLGGLGTLVVALLPR